MSDFDLLKQFDDIHIDRELCKRSYAQFVELAWPVVEPAQPFVNTWNIGAVCEHLEAVVKGEITRLVINVPPNTTKSMSCSVMLTPWLWTLFPNKKLICGCYDETLARRDSLRARNLIASPWYQQRWGHRYYIDKRLEDSGKKYSTSKGGFRMITTPGGSVTGEHADIHVIDDPIKPKDASGTLAVTQTILKSIDTWWHFTMSSRLVSYEKSGRILIMQRLHDDDLAGILLREGGYEHLCLPMEYEPERKCYTSIGFEDPRTEPGELLCEERITKDAVRKLEKDLGPVGARAQLQQDPVALSGNLFKRDKVKYYEQLPEFFETIIQSWDCSFKETGDSFVVGQVWGKKGSRFYLMDQIRERMAFSATCDAVKALSKLWPKATKKLVEAKANGIAVVDHLQDIVTGLELVEPKGGKEARANAVEPYWTAGNVYLPHPKTHPWVVAFVDECAKFPASLNDDQVDAMSQGLSYLGHSPLSKLRAAMSNVN